LKTIDGSNGKIEWLELSTGLKFKQTSL